MPFPAEITVSQLSRLVGLPGEPVVIDVRIDEDCQADPRHLPCALRRDHATVADWAGGLVGKPVVVTCQAGRKLSQGVAAWLRHGGIEAQSLDGGFEAWRAAAEPLVRTSKLPPRDGHGRTVWVTRARPKVDRIACPWLIRRFVDASAVFLFVNPAEVNAVAERFRATAFDIDDVFWSHRGETCTFDTMLAELGLDTAPLAHLARIVRGADTARPDLAPQAEGLLAASLGLSRMFKDDLAQLDAAMVLYDALYRWCRDATGETHNWPTPGKGPA